MTAWAQAADIVGVRDNFIVAGIAAQKCNAGDPDRQETHDRNFTIISRKAMEAIVARAPGGDAEEARRQDLALRLAGSRFVQLCQCFAAIVQAA